MTDLAPSLLAAALETATSTAREAGALLLAELHRPDGPRGAGSHADADEEAERLIRDRLLQAFPSFGYRGEETGEAQLDRSATFWLVDPNDGTSVFLKGARGSAVSIALIHQHRPVLGVVFAFAFPDDEGDLIAWAEGRPLTRNGRPVARAPLPERLEPEHVVLLSSGHEPFPVASSKFTKPARYRCFPSAAYRLALVAVGDGDASISTGGPTDWDVAAGHALLRAVGGGLIDREGNPISYRVPFSESVYGGSVQVSEALCRKGMVKWGETGQNGVLDLGLVEPARGQSIQEVRLLRRAQGCLLGQLAGDSLGSLVEFESAQRIAQQFPDGVRDLEDGGCWNTLAGQPTDDSEMALTLARCLVRDGRHDADAIREAYRGWVASGPFDIGGTTASGLAGRPIQESQANGSLMRIAPLAIWGHALPETELVRLAREESAITHIHPVCRDACAVFTVAIAHALRTGASPREVYEHALSFARREGVEPTIQEALERAEHELPASFERQMGWVVIAFQNAFYQLLHAPSLEEGLISTVGHGGDTDTNGAIAGALLGAVLGREAIPTRWTRAVLCCRPLGGLDGVHQPRPVTYWPVDALVVAERLLVAGRRVLPLHCAAMTGHRCVVVTGGAGALGSAVVRGLVARGFSCVALDIPRAGAALAALEAEFPGKVLGLAADVATLAGWQEALKGVEERLGPIFGAVLTAGGWQGGQPFHEQDGAVAQAMMQRNFDTVQASFQALLPGLVARREGSIVVIGSRAVERPWTSAGAAAYAASKAAVVALAQTVAQEVLEHGVRVNAVLPSTIDTAANRAAMPDVDPSRWVSTGSLAAVIAFLLSDDSRDISGVSLPVYGRA